MCHMHWTLCLHTLTCHKTMRNQPPSIQLEQRFYWNIFHHTTELLSIPGAGRDNLYLLTGLKAPHIRRRMVKEEDSWRMMEDVFNTINHITMTEERNKVYSEHNFESVSQMSREWVHEVSVGKYTRQNSLNTTYNGPQYRTQTSSNIRSGDKQYSKQPCKEKGSYQLN